jgi:hypothetical protein
MEVNVFLMFVKETWFSMDFRVRVRSEHTLPTIHAPPASQTASGAMLTDVWNATVDTWIKMINVWPASPTATNAHL